MKIARFLPLLVLLAVTLLAAGCGGGSSTSVPSDDVALVASDPVTKGQYDQLIKLAQNQAKAQNQPVPKVGTTAYKSMSDRVVAYLVAVTEYAQKAEQLGVSDAAVNAGVQKQLDKIKKVTFHGDKKLYESQLKASGLTEDTAQVRAPRAGARAGCLQQGDGQVEGDAGSDRSSSTPRTSRSTRRPRAARCVTSSCRASPRRRTSARSS